MISLRGDPDSGKALFCADPVGGESIKTSILRPYVIKSSLTVDRDDLQGPRHENMPKKRGVKSHACVPLKVVCNEMNGGLDTRLLNSYWYRTHVIGVCLMFYGELVF